MTLRIVDIIDEETFGLVPPCADPGFDHRSCDYWEDADRGSRAARSSWLEPAPPPAPAPASARAANPFAPDPTPASAFNPFATDADDIAENPFAPRPVARAQAPPGAPRKLALLVRGMTVFGSYAKVALVGDDAVAYAQFGPLSAYPRALRSRELYPRLPQSPLPAVITCIATTTAARRHGYARELVSAVASDLASRGFAAVEAYPTRGEAADATSAASVAFWEGCGFAVAIDDERFPVVRRELE